MMTALRFMEPPELIVCLGAHADDIEIGAAGTILTIADRAPEARFVFIVASAPGERADEAAASAAALLGDRVRTEVGMFEDGSLPYSDPHGVKAFVRTSVGQEVPDLVLAPRLDDAHQDHRFIADVAAQVVRGALTLGYDIPKFDGQSGGANFYVPIAEDVVKRKLDHLDGHFPTQSAKPWYDRSVFSASLRMAGVESKSDSGYAEAFLAQKVILGA